jgi:hypothetical protein
VSCEVSTTNTGAVTAYLFPLRYLFRARSLPGSRLTHDR